MLNADSGGFPANQRRKYPPNMYDSKPRVASLPIKHEDGQRLKHLNGCMVQNSGPGILKASSLTSRSCSNEYSKPDLKSLGKWRVGEQGLRLKPKTLPPP
jgi:hypothetical protein